MIRVLFSVLAVVAAVLAYIFAMPELYAVAVVLLLVAVVLLVTALRKRRREAKASYVPQQRAATPDEELEALGIMDIRPRSKTPPDEEAPAQDRTAAVPEEEAASPEAQGRTEKTSDPQRAATGPQEGAPGKPSSERRNARPTQASRERHDDVLKPLLQSLRHAVGAHTVCLLRQEDIAPQYRIVALTSGTTEVQTRGSFRTSTPLLTPTLAERPVTVRHVGDGGIEAASLGYYHARPAVREVALAPVPRPTDDPATYFLVADAEASDRLGRARSRKVLAQFARTVGSLLASADEAAFDAEAEAASTVRPRREIIADEMEKARTRGTPLALALVYLNRADEVADRGEGAIAAAERALAAQLKQAATPSRVERFGELTFGIFYHEATDVEAWTEHIQRRLDAADGALEGGISIGVALLQDRHKDPTAFRADATEALREAYESGASIILE